MCDEMPKVTEPLAAIGQAIALLREGRRLKKYELAEKAGISRNMMTKIEQGGNVEAIFYQKVAEALDFKNALEMFRAPYDAPMLRVFRLWPLIDEKTKREIARLARESIDALKE